MQYILKSLSSSISITQLLKETAGLTEIDYYLQGDCDAIIDCDFYFSGLRDNIPNTITFCRPRGDETIEQVTARLTKARQTVFLLPAELRGIPIAPSDGQLFVFLKNRDPMIIFGKMLANSVVEVRPIFKSAEAFDESCYIGPYVCIEDGAQIGKDVRFEGNNYVHSNAVIGDNVIVQPGAVIGSEGFQRDYDGLDDCTRHWPHFGKTIIENDVQIGANTCIARGMFTDTVIRRGVQIDNLTQIAHSVVIGENTRIVGSSSIEGSVKIGKRVWVGAAKIKNGIILGDNCFIGLGSVVVKDIPAGVLAYGVPAKVKNEHWK